MGVWVAGSRDQERSPPARSDLSQGRAPPSSPSRGPLRSAGRGAGDGRRWERRTRGADWLLRSTGWSARRLRGTRERKSARAHFRSLWLASPSPRLASWPLLGFAVRDAGPERREGGEGAWPGRRARGEGALLPGPGHPRVARPLVGGFRASWEPAEASSSPYFPGERAELLLPAVTSQMLSFSRAMKMG